MIMIFASLTLAFALAGVGCVAAPSLELDGRPLASERTALCGCIACFLLAGVTFGGAVAEVLSLP